MNIFDRFRSLLKKKTTTAAELAEAVTAARGTYEAAKVKALREQGRTRECLLAGADEAARHKSLVAQMNSDMMDAANFLAALEERHAEVAAAEAEAAKVARYEEAAKLRAEITAELEVEYDKHVTGLLRLLHRVTYADDAIAAANLDLPAGRELLSAVEETVREGAELPRRDVRARVVEVWAYPNGDRPLADADQARVSSHNGRTGSLPHGSGMFAGVNQVVKKRFRRVEYLGPIFGSRGDRLREMKLPALRARDPDLWTPGEFCKVTPADTLRRLNEIVSGAGTWRPEDREVQVEYVLTEELVDADAD